MQTCFSVSHEALTTCKAPVRYIALKVKDLDKASRLLADDPTVRTCRAAVGVHPRYVKMVSTFHYNPVLENDRFYCNTCGMEEAGAVPDCPIFAEGAKAGHNRGVVAAVDVARSHAEKFATIVLDEHDVSRASTLELSRTNFEILGAASCNMQVVRYPQQLPLVLFVDKASAFKGCPDMQRDGEQFIGPGGPHNSTANSTCLVKQAARSLQWDPAQLSFRRQSEDKSR